MRRLGHRHGGHQLVVEGEEHRLGPGDRAEQREDEIGEAVAVAVEGRGHEGPISRRREDPCVGGVDEGRAVGDRWMTGCRRVHLLLQQRFVERRNGPLRAVVDRSHRRSGGPECVVGDGATARPSGPLGPTGRCIASPDGPARDFSAPQASPMAIRTTAIGCTTGPSGATPGRRRPVRTMTEPPTSSRRIRFGEPTSPAPSGVVVAAFSPRPASRIASPVS